MLNYIFRVKALLLLGAALLVSSCLQPSTKEAYLEGFERFVQEVEKNSTKFTEKDWQWANKRFTRYAADYYDRFREELTLEEKVEVTLLKGRYLATREGSRLGRTIDKNLSKELEQAGKDVREYLDENLQEDLREISRGAREIGDSAVKVMEDLLREIKKKRE
ncbi:MAG TPA: hypothetical protein P5086_00495 [Prolixibacteraceae bacterium]|nr:hypothetical protein [Prolixibacteraceae bacterium]HPJ78757.1 hypothetical protein [Prolixibacteraceae bacterium]HRV87764.1 hypothetical protein [Prolixibacteraceae bacterium]